MDYPSISIVRDGRIGMNLKGKTVLAIAALLLIVIGVVIWSTRSETITGTAYPLVIKDDVGRTVEMEAEPKRIVSLSPGNTEILFALGLDERVVGVTEHCDYPVEAKERPKVGGFARISIERVVSLEPNLVFATGGVQLRIVQQLENLGIKTIVLKPKTIKGILDDILLAGKITNKNSEAEALVGTLRGRIEMIEATTGSLIFKPRIYYEIWHSPLMSVGQGTWIDELIELAGGRNIFSDSSDPYPIINSELVIERDPEVIFIKIGYMGGVAKDDIVRRPGWDKISAVKNGRIYGIEENILIRPGPRIVDGLEALAMAIHPQLFGKIAEVDP